MTSDEVILHFRIYIRIAYPLANEGKMASLADISFRNYD